MNDEAQPASLTLDGSSLLSKWGFGDGDLVHDWYADQATVGWWPRPFDHHDVLIDLVKTHLIPAVAAAGHAFIVYVIPTNHNPIRFSELDGQIVEHRRSKLTIDVYVTVTPEQIQEAIDRVKGAAA
ncbi:hypothetical protein [Leifsonia sp. Leaf264]|uniref:hypothetical protein n=1 Tax=Leifsonia sp. Leaf264 TaxID=1736314 RepID=UPI0006F99E38|nr:hypothetical protein [Leifsonia sp. Leaf264]KQO98620.1 hypothetical protein ASF30_11195 [Leifsonia sp. Leaf264]